MEGGGAGPGGSSVKLKVSLDPRPAGEVGEAGGRLGPALKTVGRPQQSRQVSGQMILGVWREGGTLRAIWLGLEETVIGLSQLGPQNLIQALSLPPHPMFWEESTFSGERPPLGKVGAASPNSIKAGG